MTPDEFRESVLPQIVSAWDRQCLCASPGFRKVVSFNFRDYGIGPVGLADSEVLIHEVIRQRFIKQGDRNSCQDETTQRFTCPRCGSVCTESYADFNIHMYRSIVTFESAAELAPRGLYLIGFYGLRQEDFVTINDFERASTVDEFIDYLRRT